MSDRYQVIIAGGGPVGTALSVELGRRGISCVVIERRTEGHRIPKGQNLTARTLEHFQAWGILDEIRAARVMPEGYPESGITAYKDLRSEYWYAPPMRELVNPYYAQKNDRLPQYEMERVLREKMVTLPGVETRIGWSVEHVEQDADGTRATITNEAGDQEIIEGDYLVGCDGARSVVRDQIGIARSGSDYDQLMVLAVFRSKEFHEGLSRFPERSTYRVMHPDQNGYWQFFGRIDVGEGFFFHAPVPADTTRENFDFLGLLQRAAGFEFAAEFDHLGFWDLRVLVAEEYRKGRIFIAGDAAHSHPPYGGFGLNNGLEDVRNLGWKLAARLQGWGGDELLNSYGAERQPVFKSIGEDFIADRIRKDAEFFDTYNPDKDKEAFDEAWESLPGRMGSFIRDYEPHYEGSPIVDGPAGAVSSARGTHTFEARSGHHLPPQSLSSGKNVFDELGNDFALLAFDAAEGAAHFSAAATSLGLPIKIIEDSLEDGREQYESKLVLVRPDHFIAWHGNQPPEDVEALLVSAAGQR